MKDNAYLKFAREIVETNKANGFDPSCWENLPTKLMFAVTELDEAVYEFPVGHDEFSYEIADTAIRILDALQNIWPDDWCLRAHGIPTDTFSITRGLHENLWGVLRCLCLAAESWRKDERTDVCTHLETALLTCRMLADTYEVPLAFFIQRKIEKNKTRDYLHGKKRKDG